MGEEESLVGFGFVAEGVACDGLDGGGRGRWKFESEGAGGEGGGDGWVGEEGTERVEGEKTAEVG